MGVGDFFSRRGQASPESAQDEAMPLAFLGSIVESSDDAIIGLTLDGSIISWNAAATRIYGYDEGDATGSPVSLLIPADFREEQLRILEKVRRGERLNHFETTRLTKDGRRICVSLTVSPVRDATGTVFAASEVARDIEPQKQSERESAQLAAIVESSDDAIVSKSLDGIIQSWNAAAERIFGYTPEEIIGKHITTIIPPELHDEERTIAERIRAGERIEHFDTIRIGKNGRRIPISLTVSPIRDMRGEIIGASKIARDFSDRQRAERELRDSRHRLASEALALARLSEASSRLWKSQSLAAGLDEILHTSMSLAGATKCNIQLMNAARNTLSIVAHEGFDAGFLATFEHMAAGESRAACGRALAGGQAVVIEDVLADDDYAPFHEVARAAGYRAVVCFPLSAADGSTLGAISMHYPSPHRPSEAQMRRLQLYCRTASDYIHRIRLEHALRERESALRDADRRKDEFLALLAHELRNPLAPIRHALAAARNPEATAEQKARSYAIVERQVVHMGRLLDDLVDISRITLGTVALKKVPTTLSAAIETSVEAAQPFIDAKRHELTISVPSHPVALEADPVRLAQIFSNLLINAAKYTTRGGHIELSVANGDGQVVVTVRDNGIGISPEMMSRLFTLFAQAQPALGRTEEGLGVGLALVRALVGLHGGTVEARSEGIGRGSEFVVRLPVGQPGTGPDEPTPRESAAPGRQLRVLVVDDNRDAADSCATMLELSGHQVRTAYNGTRALQFGESFEPDIVLLDIGLPDLNGYEVARRIRASAWGADLVLVAVTGWGKEEDQERAFAAGFNEHLTKPVAPEAVEAVVRSAAAEATQDSS
jgi:PAS domain S-box-containing protein